MNNNTTISTFELHYTNYKKYLSFYEGYEKEQLDSMRPAVEELFKSENLEEDAVTFVLNTRALPQMYAKDLNQLKEKLIVAFDFVRDLEEIPAEIKKECEELTAKKDKPLYIIEAGKPVEIDKERIEIYKASFKSPEMMKMSIQMAKNLLNLTKKE